MNSSEFEKLLRVINRQQQTLQLILSVLDRPKLGLHSDVGNIYIYCNRHNNCLWYTIANGNPEPITHAALTGYLRSLKFEKVERRGKEVNKLIATIEGDRNYILESGYDSHFSKGLLAAIATLKSQQLLHPITIQPQPGNDESVLFCRVWADGEYIKSGYDESTDWRETAKQALAVVKEANDMP